MKKLIFLLLILVSFNLQAEEFKLSCNIRLVTYYSVDGSSETHQYNEVFEITDYGKSKYIMPSSVNFRSVSTSNRSKNHPNTLSIDDFSDLSKWDITVNTKSKIEGKVDVTSIRIDRNVGKIWYSADFNTPSGNTILETGVGDCEKVDVSKKKF